MIGPDLWNLLEDLAHPRVLVLGDVRLERWTWGDLDPVGAGGPGPRMRARQRETRLGGAARIGRMLNDLETDAVCGGFVGDDDEGATLRGLLAAAGIEAAYLLDVAQPGTPLVERFVGRVGDDLPPQIWTVEDEAALAPAPQLEEKLAQRLVDDVGEFDAVVIADRGLGACTPSLVRRVIAAAREADKPVVVDPAPGADFSVYFGATAITPNRTEAEAATGVKIRSVEEALKAGTMLCRQQNIEHAFVTLGGEGIAAAKRHGRGKHVATVPRGLQQTTGAGDMATAVIALSLAMGVNPLNAARLANVAAGLYLEYAGGRRVDRDGLRGRLMQVKPLSGGKVLSREDLAKKIEQCRSQKRRVVFTNGCFDLLHAGHVTYLQEAAALGDVLVVGLNSDASVRGLKGPARPVIRQEDRATLLAALSCVDFVTLFDEPTPADLIRRLRPDVLVKGGDYRIEEVVGHDFVQSYGGRVYIAPLVEGVSTTAIIKSMAA